MIKVNDVIVLEVKWNEKDLEIDNKMLINTPVIIHYKLDISGDEESSSF